MGWLAGMPGNVKYCIFIMTFCWMMWLSYDSASSLIHLVSYSYYCCWWRSVLSDVWCSVVPDAPTSLAVSNIHATHVRLQFIPGFSGHTIISSWIVEAQKNYVVSNDSWTQIYTVSDPDTVSVNVYGLRPYTAYRLRLISENIAGQSPPSQPTVWFNTLQAIPSTPPTEIRVRALNETALLLRWAVCCHSTSLFCLWTICWFSLADPSFPLWLCPS